MVMTKPAMEYPAIAPAEAIPELLPAFPLAFPPVPPPVGDAIDEEVVPVGVELEVVDKEAGFEVLLDVGTSEVP
jgi:hypothetical protein